MRNIYDENREYPDGALICMPKGYVCVEKEYFEESLYALRKVTEFEEKIFEKVKRRYLLEDAVLNYQDYKETLEILTDNEYNQLVDLFLKYQDEQVSNYNTWLTVIEKFEKTKRKRFFISFGSWEEYPYQNTYMIVVADNKNEATEKFREKYPDKTPGYANYSDIYSAEEWEDTEGKFTRNIEPAEIIE